MQKSILNAQVGSQRVRGNGKLAAIALLLGLIGCTLAVQNEEPVPGRDDGAGSVFISDASAAPVSPAADYFPARYSNQAVRVEAHIEAF